VLELGSGLSGKLLGFDSKEIYLSWGCSIEDLEEGQS